MQVLLSKDGNSITLETPPESVRYFTELALNNPEVSITFNPNNLSEGHISCHVMLRFLHRCKDIQQEKIKAIKLLRELTDFTLTEAKNFIEDEYKPTFACPTNTN